MPTHTVEEMLVCRIASEVDESGVTVLGSFTPLAYAAYMLAKLTSARDAWIVGFNAVGMSAVSLDLVGVEAAAYQGAAATRSFLDLTMSIHLGHRGLVECISPAQMDGSGAFNLSAIGSYAHPTVRLPGGAGSPEVVQNYSRIVAYFGRHDKRRLVDKVDFRTGAREPIARARREALGLLPGPIRVITPLCVMVKDDDDLPFRLETLTPGVKVKEVLDNTAFEVEVPDDVGPTPLPTDRELVLLRERIDPDGTIYFDSLGARERKAYVRDLLARRWDRAVKTAGSTQA